jgi:hypothetical protein
MACMADPAAAAAHRHCVHQLLKAAPVGAWDDQAAQVKRTREAWELPVCCQPAAVNAWHVVHQRQLTSWG